MTLTFHALWMLCGLSAAIFATYVGSAATTPHTVSELVGHQKNTPLPPEQPSETLENSRRTLRPLRLNVFSLLGRSAGAWIAMAVGFVVANLWIGAGRGVDAAWVGGLVAGVAAAQLLSPSHAAIMTVSAGAVAALWASLLRVQGLPQPAAVASGAVLPMISAYLSQRSPAFAPRLLQEEALVALLALGGVAAVAPTVAQGWQSAIALNLGDKSASMPLMPVWILSVIGASMTLGAVWSLWRRG